MCSLNGVKMPLGKTTGALAFYAAEPDAPFDGDAMIILNKLRLMMARVKCSAKVDVFKACALLSSNSTTAATAYAEALLRVLRHGLGRSPTMYRPGAIEVSGDEAWLLRVILCVQQGDEDSLRFLTTRRLAKETLRPTTFLIRNLAAQIDEI